MSGVANRFGAVQSPSHGVGETLDEKPTVFIVDDDISIRESLEGLVAAMGWQSRSFASAETFLSCPPTRGPCCLVLDVSLPNLNGLDLQALVSPERSEMPIIFISGFAD